MSRSMSMYSMLSFRIQVPVDQESQNLNPGQDTRANKPRNEHERRHEGTHEGAHHSSSTRDTDQESRSEV
jgi:hypothetical protein